MRVVILFLASFMIFNTAAERAEGNVVSFSKAGDKIVIKECPMEAAVKKTADCAALPGTSERQVPAQQFRNHLKNAFVIRSFSDPGEKSKDGSRAVEADPEAWNKNLRMWIGQEKARVDELLEFYCATFPGNACPMKTSTVWKLKSELEKMGSPKEADKATNAANKMIHKFIDELIDSPKAKHSWAPRTLLHQALRSYLRPSGLQIATVKIKAGSFVMGSPESEPGRQSDENQVRVTLTKDFEIGATAVTQGQWYAVMGTNASFFARPENCKETFVQKDGVVPLCPDLPMETISWYEAQDFLTRLNSEDPTHHYRLPTEAELEYVTRAGSQTAFFYGDDPARLEEYAWFGVFEPRAVATKKPNPWGLYDVHGNQWVWVQDWYGKLTNATDPIGPRTGTLRVYRGGGFKRTPEIQRSAYRNHAVPGYRGPYIGLRVVKTPK